MSFHSLRRLDILLLILVQDELSLTTFYLAYTGFDNKEHMKALNKVGDLL